MAVTRAINASRIHSPDRCIGNYITNRSEAVLDG
jgi:hypothetical protein